MNRGEFERRLGRSLVDRAHFVEAVTTAIGSGRPYAAGKIGNTEQALLEYPLLLREGADPRSLRAFEVSLVPRAHRTGGVFPANAESFRQVAERLAAELGTLDCLGLFRDGITNQLRLLQGHRFEGSVINYLDQEPDRGIPADDDRCYLPSFRDRRLLIVSPFADLLRDRASKETYEAVWSKIGKRWFAPAHVDAVSFPYGFEPRAQRRYGTSLNLLEEISSEIASRDFDVALISAGSLGIPIATSVKRQGRVGISLGGHLQIVFGVHGERWLIQPAWVRNYFNEAWIRVPEAYRPDMATTEGDYW